MDAFPLIRTRWSNEHIMAALFAVLVIYLVPGWLRNPAAFAGFLAVLAAALLIDTAGNFLRYKRPACSVAAAVTAGILQVLTPEVPWWGRLLGVVFALLAGKHVWGGTGRNPFNPALIGFVAVSLLFGAGTSVFTTGFWLVPAVLLSLPFAASRPYAAAGFSAGMLLALGVVHSLSVGNILSSGIVFWSCLIVTDPVTVTRRPLTGAVSCFASGFAALYLSGSPLAIAVGVLVVNGISKALDFFPRKAPGTLRPSLRMKKLSPGFREQVDLLDLTGGEAEQFTDVSGLSGDEILKRIEANGVFGYGGAAFPTSEKIRTVMKSDAIRKHLIVNAVECDPGLIHDKWLLKHHSDEILQGIGILRKCVPFDTITLAVKDAAGLEQPDGVKIHRLPDIYPVGAEKILIEGILGQRILPGTVPARLGILVLNVQTVLSVYEAVCKNRAAHARYLTVANFKERDVRIVKVGLGTKIREVMDKVYPGYGYAFAGGGAMQARIADDEAVVDKSVNFLAIGEYPRFKESPLCSRCGNCMAGCPAGLQVYEIARLVDEGRVREAGMLQAEQCISCGSCSVVCLAGRNLSARTKAAREYAGASAR